MNFKFFIISVLVVSGLIGSAFAQQTIQLTPQEFTQEEIDEMQHKAVLITLNEGTFMIELFPEVAPNHVHNFLKLIESGYYDGMVFHRIIPGFMIQVGDPNTKDPEIDRSLWGTGGPGYQMDNEFNFYKHDRGIVSMARQNHPDTAGSQFFIVHQDSNFLDGDYTVFGRIITPTSFETLDRIANIETGNRDIPLDISKAVIYKAVSVPISIAVPYMTGQYGIPNYEIQYAIIHKVCMPDGSGCTDYRPDRMITQSIMETDNTHSSDQGGGCLIATAAFGSEMAPQVQFLRELRDNTVLQTESGTSFMTGFNQFYYSFSPAIADYERENPAFKEAVKITLTPLLTSLTSVSYTHLTLPTNREV